MKEIISKSKALQLIQNGTVVKSTLEDGILEIKRVKKGIYEVSIVSDEEIDGENNHIYLGDFTGLMKSINGILGKSGLYIEK